MPNRRHLRVGFFFIKSVEKAWSKWLPLLEGSDSPANAERKHYAQIAGVSKLEPWTNLSWIDRYAKAYGVLPRVARQERFSDFMPLLALWNQQNEYQERYIEVEKAMKK